MGSFYAAALKEPAYGRGIIALHGKKVYIFYKINYVSNRQPALMPEGPLSGKDHGDFWLRFVAGLNRLEITV